MMDDLKQTLENYRYQIDKYLKDYFKKRSDIPLKLKQSMEYSVFAGGKRIRPILCLVFAEIFGENIANVLPFACGLELIHTYSLVHDDLPAMDNDDLRRGKPTNHKVFGEAIAILAGDGLLTEGFSLFLRSNISADRLLKAIDQVAEAVGPKGMVGGQVIDMELTGSDTHDFELLKKMHRLKTGEFITASCVSGAILGGANDGEVSIVREFGENIGLAFQIADDILDVLGDEKKIGKPVGSDQQKGKITYPALFGLKKSFELGWKAVFMAQESLKALNGHKIDFLMKLSRYIMERTE